MSSVVDGNVTTTNYYNQRMQPCRITATTRTAPSSCTDSANTGNVLDLKYDLQIGQADNGNVYGITNNKASTRSQSFSYHYLNRLLTATSGAWSESYVYDAWGNLTKNNASGGDTVLDITINNKNQVMGQYHDACGNNMIVGGAFSCPGL